MTFFNKDMAKLAGENDFFQKEVFLDKRVQVVLMSLAPGEEIGMETHRADQTTFFVAGKGQAIVDGAKGSVSANHMIVIPQGAEHNIVNTGSEPLKLFSVYAPPAEPHGIAAKTKADAEEIEKSWLTKAAEAVKEKISG
ncbi:cupin domain-containing protein [Sphingomonas sp.]|jgi:mannose-6-phosphate isomerase-like protein (cupin superfamily)|uniref:cupin domain-containing protein n=1 Tax=Sphingomonas sp. TaxID=28214 RepID=UPI002D7E6D95|nr:cupin domain-containing protein [Sphingomonas sp.]HEU0043499.1 cupin domain-containing protein [Sphingomonas sp.]